MRAGLFIALLAVACQSSKTSSSSSGSGSAAAPAPAPAAADACSGVGDGVAKVWDKQIADADTPEVKKAAEQKRAKLVSRLERHCRDDHWSADGIACVRAASPSCDGKLTPDQQQKLASDPAE